jgi:hypothetical protein
MALVEHGSVDYPDTAWKMDPVLELWVNVKTVPVTVRMAVVLDGMTCNSVMPIIEELLAEGRRDFAIQVDDLDPPDEAGFLSLAGIERMVKDAGGSVSWSNGPESYEPPPP